MAHDRKGGQPLANVKNNAAAQETQRRLLQAAGEVFAERGFHAATIKQITDRAGASLASVNYHFHDKLELYAAVVRRIGADAAALVPPADLPGADAPSRLRHAIRHIVIHMLGRDQPLWERVLLAREFARPTPALESLLEAVARPLHAVVSAQVAEILRCDRHDPAVLLATASIVGLCVHHMEHQQLILMLHPTLAPCYDASRVADHIADFCLSALQRQPQPYAEGRPARPRRRPTATR